MNWLVLRHRSIARDDGAIIQQTIITSMAN